MGWLAELPVVAGAYTGVVGSIPAAEEHRSGHADFLRMVGSSLVVILNCSWESALQNLRFSFLSASHSASSSVVFGLSVDQALYYYCSIWGRPRSPVARRSSSPTYISLRQET